MLDHDHIVTDFMRHLERTFGREQAERCLDIFRELRDELGYADSLGTLQRYRIAYPHDPHLLTVSNFFCGLSLSEPPLSEVARRATPGSFGSISPEGLTMVCQESNRR